MQNLRLVERLRPGGVVQRYGRPGEGPGEFQRMGPAFILNDSVVVVADARTDLFKLFSREDGEHLGSIGREPARPPRPWHAAV